MRIVIYKGSFQYDVVNDFGRAIGEVLKNAGHEVVYLDLNSENVINEIIQVFSKPADFVLSFNGIGYNIKVKGFSLYDYLNVPFVMWLVDHPVHHYERVISPIKNKIVVCIDETHIDFIENHISEEIVTSFIPHGAEKLELNLKEKEYEVIFAGHISNIEEFDHVISNVEEYIPNIRKIVMEKLETEGNIDLCLLMEDFKVNYPEILRINGEKNVMVVLDRYIRAVKRNKILSEILNQKIHVDFFGNIPENHPFLKHDYFTYHGSVSFEEVKSIIRKSKIVVNVLPNFPKGGHERIFTSMMLGALPLSDTNDYIENHLKNILKFSYSEVHQIGTRIKDLLSNNDKLEELITNNHKVAYEHHSWDKRVEELLYVVEAAKQYFVQSKV